MQTKFNTSSKPWIQVKPRLNVHFLFYCIDIHLKLLPDTDSDGKVTPEEFAKWLSSQETMEGLKTYFHNKSLQIFSDIDTDKSGYIDKKELKDISERLGQKDLDTEKVFKEMDMDSDGKVSKEEFIAWMDTHDGTGFHKMLTSKMGLGGTGWLEQKDSSFLG